MGISGIIIASLLSCLGQLCQKQAACVPSGSAGRHRAWLWLFVALVAMGLGLLVWLVVLQSVPVGLAYPMMSLNFIWVSLAAHWIWGERLTRRHWLGILLIILGIILLNGGV
ncbi:4-amino-4-deoxy-L-arabinose-phosphoundecaprenol flippase subunit ArnE [Mangrovibacter plantisponsor]|uniref:Undecaprenyl phosphate-alpha-L-ara4N flippase subunit ArnE n=1 Tax=Mangrovibacter plantisponsor TaxID=451513 RepID=A0A317PRG0_9ENTR|nr:4-amino-4-deoxy-L-arabinose-phosphoundecaprenol flippase subunit ArnE [Mangrovibacter plantisponsor]PWW02977.1 undecaprenyl phosphate-alpha-L-ara4N flippase subunit ArnE [Mangrovibacter plantisponsor]